MAKEETARSTFVSIRKIARQLAIRKAESRKRKYLKKTLIHIQDLPEHAKKDIGWLNG